MVTCCWLLAAWAQGLCDQCCFLKNLYHPLRRASLSKAMPNELCYSKKRELIRQWAKTVSKKAVKYDSTQLGRSCHGRNHKLQHYLYEAHLLCTFTREVVGIFHTSHCCANMEQTFGWSTNAIILRHKLTLKIFCPRDLQPLMSFITAVNTQQGAQWYDQNGLVPMLSSLQTVFLGSFTSNSEFLGGFQLLLDHWFD